MTIVAKIHSEVVIQDNSPEGLLTLFDGLIPANGMQVKNVNGRKLIMECSDFRFVEIAELTEDGDVIDILKRTPDVKYHISENKTFDKNDMLRINGKGDFNIIVMQSNIFLYNAEDLSTIELDGASNIDEIKKYLNINYPYYEVLRKIKG